MVNQHNMSSISNKKKFIIKKTTNRRTIKIKIKKKNINRLVDKTNQYMKNIGFNVKNIRTDEQNHWHYSGLFIHPIGIIEKALALILKSIGINKKAMVV